VLNALLCRAAVGLSHAVYDDASDLTQRRLDLFAEIGAVEVVKGAVSPPTPGTSAWWRAAVREAVYAPLGGPVQYVRETVNWTGLLKKRPRRSSAPPAA
jgi:hypothetical protein